MAAELPEEDLLLDDAGELSGRSSSLTGEVGVKVAWWSML